MEALALECSRTWRLLLRVGGGVGYLWGPAGRGILPFLEGGRCASKFSLDADWRFLLFEALALERSRPWMLLLRVRGGVDVRLTGGLGLGVRVEAVDGLLPPVTGAVDGVLSGQVPSVGRSRGRPLDLCPAVDGLVPGFGGVEAARGDPERRLCDLGLGGKRAPDTVYWLLLLEAPAAGSSRPRRPLHHVEGWAFTSALRLMRVFCVSGVFIVLL